MNAVRSSRIALPARLPSNGFMLSRPPAALPEGSCRLGIMRALTPARLAHAAQVSPLSCLAFRTSHPQPRYGPERRFRSRLNALDGSCDPGFAMDEQARRAMPPNGFVILQAVRSPPTAPHPVSRRRSCLRLHVSRLHIGWTFTSLTRQHHGRTHPRERGDPEFCATSLPNRRTGGFRSRPAPYGPWMPACAGMTTLGVTFLRGMAHNALKSLRSWKETNWILLPPAWILLP